MGNLKVYQFTNTKNNRQKPWKRHFAASSMSDAKDLAKSFEKRMNEANSHIDDLLLTFDYESVKVVETSRIYDIRGYIELDGC
jgi:hypothetical protein